MRTEHPKTFLRITDYYWYDSADKLASSDGDKLRTEHPKTFLLMADYYILRRFSWQVVVGGSSHVRMYGDKHDTWPHAFSAIFAGGNLTSPELKKEFLYKRPDDFSSNRRRWNFGSEWHVRMFGTWGVTSRRTWRKQTPWHNWRFRRLAHCLDSDFGSEWHVWTFGTWGVTSRITWRKQTPWHNWRFRCLAHGLDSDWRPEAKIVIVHHHLE